MKHRITSLLLALLMLISILPSAALAANEPWMSPFSLHGTVLERSLYCTEEDGFIDYTFDPNGFTNTGCFGGMKIDLDNDGYEEELQIKLEDDAAYAIVYDEVDGKFDVTARVPLFANNILGNIQANDVFLKHNGERWVLYCESWYQNNAFADGATWAFDAYCYEANGLVNITEVWADGTDIYGTLDEWRSDEYIAEYRPDLLPIAAELDSHNFDIEGVYWGNMICEQDTSLTVLSRMMAVQDVPVEELVRFTMEGGHKLGGFRAMLIDCGVFDYTLPEEYYLCNNEAPYDDEGVFFAEDSATDDENYYADEFIIPDSDVRKLTKEELSAYDKDTLALIRNEILARYGYPFQKQKYKDYFGSKSWYFRNEDFTYNMLTSLEMENIELIKKLEAAG